MNTLEKLLLTLTIIIFSIANIYAQPCIGDNCMATIGKSKDSSNKSKFATLNKTNNTEDKNIKNEFEMIALDDNTEIIELEDNSIYYSDNKIPKSDDGNYTTEYIDGEIILVDNSDITYTEDIEKLKLAKVLYACEDIANNIVACDNEKKEECECV